MDPFDKMSAMATISQFVNERECAARQQRLDMFACAAMTSLALTPVYSTNSTTKSELRAKLARASYTLAEAMEAERERRIRGGR